MSLGALECPTKTDKTVRLRRLLGVHIIVLTFSVPATKMLRFLERAPMKGTSNKSHCLSQIRLHIHTNR